MEFVIDGNNYNVIINKKSIKNTYIRVDDNLNIVVNTNYFTTKKKIKNLLDLNIDALKNMINKRKKENDKKHEFYYLGNKYDVIDCNLKDVTIDGNRIYASSKKLDKWYRNEMKKIFSERLEFNYKRFEENIPFPSLRIRTMKTRWGVCNIKSKTITLNSLLLKYDIKAIDYVIIHELSHLIHFNHSKDFWLLVSKYCPDYKNIKKVLKES